jgi:hypothetical protein
VKQTKLKGSKDTFTISGCGSRKVPSVDGLCRRSPFLELRAVAWRKGGRGVYVNLANQRVSDAHICELLPGASISRKSTF